MTSSLVVSIAPPMATATMGQARSAVGRISSTVQRTSKETFGQTQERAEITGKDSRRSAAALLDEAPHAIEPDGECKPVALDDWTRAVLDERAPGLDIDGRNSMTKRATERSFVRALRPA